MAKIISSGKYPTVYQFEENGEHYMLGSDVGAYLGHFKGNLYKRFPSLERRIMNAKERESMALINIDNRTLCNMGTMVVKASEAMEIINGEGDYLRKKNTPAAKRNDKAKESINVAFCRKRSNRSDLQDLRENLTFMPEARGKKVAKRYVPIAIDRSRKTLSPIQEYQSLACTVINNVTLSKSAKMEGSPRCRKNPIPKNDKISETQIVPPEESKQSLDSLDTENLCHDLLEEVANAMEELIPIRLDLEIDGTKLRDTFTWNSNEKLFTPRDFAEMLCRDLDLPEGKFVQSITTSMEQQINSYNKTVKNYDKTQSGNDKRVAVKLNLHVGNMSLQDQFEWDISEPKNSPEEFAKILCKELGLSGEFVTAISYSIHGQLNWYKSISEKDWNKLPKVSHPAIRAEEDLDDWCPYLDVLSDEEILKILKDQERHVRRLRRLANIS